MVCMMLRKTWKSLYDNCSVGLYFQSKSDELDYDSLVGTFLSTYNISVETEHFTQ